MVNVGNELVKLWHVRDAVSSSDGTIAKNPATNHRQLGENQKCIIKANVKAMLTNAEKRTYQRVVPFEDVTGLAGDH